MDSNGEQIVSSNVSFAQLADILKGQSLQLGGAADIMRRMDEQHNNDQKALEEARKAALPETKSCIVAEGKNNEFIFLLNLAFELGIITGISKKDFFAQMAKVCGAPTLENYSTPLNHFVQNKTFDDFVARIIERIRLLASK